MSHSKAVKSPLSRRQFLGAAGAAALAGACARASRELPSDGRTAASPAPAPAFRPAAAKTCAPTADNIEGPFFKAGAPSRAVLADESTPGIPLEVSGAVTGSDCAPLAGARMEIWHADHRGAYDNDGYQFRGVMITGDDGAFQLRTIVPGHYLNGRRYRPAHIHVKLTAAGHRPLTTQLYFAGDRWNDGDPFIRDSLIMPVARRGKLVVCRFDFALATA
jgi:protocatechuate 3,4-dioxygenase beta subunit